MSKGHRNAALAGILLLAAFFRFWHITETPPGLYPDEAMNGTNAQEAIRTGDFKIFYPENNGREGLFMNIQSISLRVFGNEPWALRVVSALFGILTVLGIYLLTKELFRNQELGIKNYGNDNVPNSYFLIHNSELVALFATFFLATSFWHINFSRIGFRAIMVPFLLVWAFYFYFKMVRQMQQGDIKKAGAELSAIAAGIFYGIGFHTYLAFRVTPLLLIPAFIYGWKRYKLQDTSYKERKCFPCLFVLFLFVTFVVALPIGYYFLQNPLDFAGRTAQVTVFASPSPAFDLAKNIGKTIGMFFVMGDWNWRHNLAGAPLLWWPVSVLFAIGILLGLKRIFNFQFSIFKTLGSAEFFLFSWLAILSIPVVISNEGLPHALRAIGMIPPVMILSAIGLAWIIEHVRSWIPQLIARFPKHKLQIMRIQKEALLLLLLFFGIVTINTYINYFMLWANSPHTANAFTYTYVDVGKYVRSLPNEAPIYVIINEGGVDVRGLPMPAQTTMFLMGEGVRSRGEVSPRNVSYILPEDIDTLTISSARPVYFAMLKDDFQLRTKLQTLFPNAVIK